MVLKLENLIGAPSVMRIVGIIHNFVKECDIHKLPHKTPRIKIITAVLNLTKAIKKPKREKQERMQIQLLPSVASSQVGGVSEGEKHSVNLKKRLQHKKARINASRNTSLKDFEDQDLETEIQEIIEILRNALMNMNSDGETRELRSAVGIFVKSGFQTFKEHRKHIEKAMLHINAQKLLNKNVRIVNVIRSAINKLNEINAIYRLNKTEVKASNKKHIIGGR